MKSLKLAAYIASASLLVACGGSSSSDSNSNQDDTTTTPAINMEKARAVLNTNAEIAYAAYTDSVKTAEDLKTALAAFRAEATKADDARDDAVAADLLKAAKKAWLVSREPYGQTEVYRFRNSPIDSTDYESEDGPEGDINAWPLGEALIDYVQVNDTDFGTDQIGVTAHGAGDDLPTAIDVNNAATNNIIETTSIEINAALLSNTATADDEHDVIAGYHAIEFLLWGQDLRTDNQNPTNGTDRAEAINATDMGGQRPLTDFTTDANAERRHQYLEVAVDKLIADLEQVQAGWAPNVADNYRANFTTITNEADAKQKLTEILTGMGTLSEGELAGERMQIAFSSNSQEDEHSCFSDNTHRDIWLNAEGVSNSYTGTYAGYDSTLDGTDDVTTNAVNGYGIDDYLAEVGLDSLATQVTTALTTTETNYKAIDTAARDGSPFDVLIQTASDASPVAKTIVALNAQANLIQEIATDLGLGNVVDEDASACDTQDPTAQCEE